MLYDIFVKAISLSQDEQKTYLIEIKKSHPELFDELLEMIKDDETSKNMNTDYWSSLMASESASITTVNNDLTSIIISSFKLTELIDKGGMGSVYKAQRCDDQFEQTVAIKILHSELEKIIGEHALIREAGFMAKLTHPNIGKVFDAGVSEDGHHFIVMEYINGCSITKKFEDESLTQSTKLQLFCDLCDAVNHAHQMQVIHADLKPANILITQDNQVKVLDFGIARMFNSRSEDTAAAYTSYLNAMTASYASPELLGGERPSMYSDIYALGKVFSALLLQQKSKKIDYYGELESIVKKATAQVSTERYASVLELKNDIVLFINKQVVKVFPASNLYKTKKFIFKRHPITALLVAVLLVSITTLTTNLFIQQKSLKQAKEQSDLMVEKLSILFQLIDRKKTNGQALSADNFLTYSSKLLNDKNLNEDSIAKLKLTLANSYNSNGKTTEARQLYKEIIQNIDVIQNKDIAFEAGGKLAQLLTHLYDLELIESDVGSLLPQLEYSEKDNNLPKTPAQAIFYHRYLDGMKYIQINKQARISYGLKHTALLRSVIKNYWPLLSKQLKAETTGFLARCLYTQLEFNSNSIYSFEQTKPNYFENNVVPVLNETLSLLNKSIALHNENNGQDDVARGELILAGIYSLLNIPKSAIESAEKAIRLSKKVLGDNHPNLINRYGELSKDFLYENPVKSIEYALKSVQLAQQFSQVSNSQYLLALNALLNSLEAAGSFEEYQKVAEQYFKYYLDLPDDERNETVVALVIETLQDYYNVIASPPNVAKALVNQIEQDYFTKNELTDFDKKLQEFFTIITSIPNINNKHSLVSKLYLDKSDRSTLDLTREKVNLIWYKALNQKNENNILQEVTSINWSNKESNVSVFKIDVLVKTGTILLKNKKYEKADLLLQQAKDIYENKSLPTGNAWKNKISLLEAEILISKKQNKNALTILNNIKVALYKNFPQNSLVRQSFSRLLLKSSI
jgi:serine/threonine protein kinase